MIGLGCIQTLHRTEAEWRQQDAAQAEKAALESAEAARIAAEDAAIVERGILDRQQIAHVRRSWRKDAPRPRNVEEALDRAEWKRRAELAALDAELAAWQRAAAGEPAAIADAVHEAIASAEAFRLAIDALPVGKDIRRRLGEQLDRHLAAIRRLSEAQA